MKGNLSPASAESLKLFNGLLKEYGIRQETDITPIGGSIF